MKTLCLIVSLIIPILSVSAQEVTTEPPQQTHAPADARYEMIQSSIAAKFTVKLDKYSGDVWQIVARPNGSITWQLIVREKHPSDVTTPNRVNYQIFTSGITLRDTFLLNINTGATWRLAEEVDDKYLFWKSILFGPSD